MSEDVSVQNFLRLSYFFPIPMSILFSHFHEASDCPIQASLDVAVDYAEKRLAFGVPIAKQQAIQVS